PQIVREAAAGLANADITVLNGADGLGEIAAGLVSQGLSIFDAVRKNLSPADEPLAEDDTPARKGATRENGAGDPAQLPQPSPPAAD
ncbi:MAG: hypothetical protein ACRDK8_13715, partial [Solirubrobacteraceae bacterium]